MSASRSGVVAEHEVEALTARPRYDYMVRACGAAPQRAEKAAGIVQWVGQLLRLLAKGRAPTPRPVPSDLCVRIGGTPAVAPWARGFSRRPCSFRRSGMPGDGSLHTRSEEHTSELQSLRHLV